MVQDGLSFIDDCRVIGVYLLKHDSEVNKIFPIFHKMIYNQFGKKFHILHIDNGKEYFNNELISYCQKEDIIVQSSCILTNKMESGRGKTDICLKWLKP